MVSKDNLSDTVQQDTPVHVQWQPSGAVWHTYDSKSPPLDMHLVAVFKGDKWSTVHSAEITAALRAATKIIRPQVGFTPDDVSARSMQAGAAVAPLVAHGNTYTIHLVGRWRSNAMLRYLHTTAQTFTEGLVVRMVQHGDYALIPPAHGD